MRLFMGCIEPTNQDHLFSLTWEYQGLNNFLVLQFERLQIQMSFWNIQWLCIWCLTVATRELLTGILSGCRNYSCCMRPDLDDSYWTWSFVQRINNEYNRPSAVLDIKDANVWQRLPTVIHRIQHSATSLKSWTYPLSSVFWHAVSTCLAPEVTTTDFCELLHY